MSSSREGQVGAEQATLKEMIVDTIMIMRIVGNNRDVIKNLNFTTICLK
jgi:hypothetical protein